MGGLQRFERRLEELVHGAFGRVFKDQVEPVEIAAALQRECDDRKAVVGSQRILVPNEFFVELGTSDYERLSPYGGPLGQELAAMVSEHAAEQRYAFVGPVTVTLEQVDDLGTGFFRVRSGVTSTGQRRSAKTPPAPARPQVQPPAPPRASPSAAPPAPPPAPAAPVAAAPAPLLGREGRKPAAPRPPARNAAADDATVAVSPPPMPRLLVPVPGDPERHSMNVLTSANITIGRGVDADLRLPDTGVSRRHAQLRRHGDGYVIIDMGSTNGTSVNGRNVSEHQLRNGDRIEIGTTTMVYRDDGRGVRG